MKYILNSAVITAPGTYSYRLLTIDEAKDWLESGYPLSTVGYQETAIAFHLLTGFAIDVNKQQIKMEAGDEALVFRLTKRLSESELKGKMGLQYVIENYELGLLTCAEEDKERVTISEETLKKAHEASQTYGKLKKFAKENNISYGSLRKALSIWRKKNPQPNKRKELE